MTQPDRTPPLVIIGIDAGDPELLERWADDGYLPTIQSLMRRGCWGITSGTEMISEHGLWVSLFSGISRAQHEYYYFRQLRPGTYDIRNMTGVDVDVSPFWSLLAKEGKKVVVVDVPDGYPIQGIAGNQVANWAVHNPLAPTSALPGELLGELRGTFRTDTRIDEKLDGGVEDDRQIYRRLLARVDEKGALCRHLLAKTRFDLAVMVFAESHTGGHQFWQYRPDARRTARANAGRDMANAIRDIYVAIDAQIATLLPLLPENANIVVVSSVGLRDQYPMHGLSESFCRQLGYQAAPHSAERPVQLIDGVRRIVPESWRVAVSRHFPRAVRERIVANQFRHGTDWSSTTAYALPSSYTSHLRVNLRGRDPCGVVEPGDDYHSVLARLESDLRLLVDPVTGRCPVKSVVRSADWFGGGTPTLLPDMLVEWQASDRFIERLVHPKAELVQERPEFFRGSDHSLHGFVAAAGPGIGGRGELREIPLLDLAPTFLGLMGIAVDARMHGRRHAGMLRDAAVSER
ncbi:MAG: alkaline phosphatase family protein [Anaerolineae bacterium]|nr:alkaline phosphatase family protein [Gemmatimonadaceae bacterium]